MRAHWLLAMWSAVVAVIGSTVVVDDRLDQGGGGGDQVVAAPNGTVAAGTGDSTTSSTTAPSVVPPAGQVRVAGRVTAVHLDGAVLEPRAVPTPLTVVSDRGFGNGGELTTVLVDGAPSSIVWDGGRPFVLSSGPAMVLDPVAVDLTAEGLRLALGGGAHSLQPGAYRLDTPVAVGSAGIATPRDTVSFDAVDGSLFEARGDAALVLDGAQPRRFLGPGAVRLEGDLQIIDAAGSTAAPAISVDLAAYDLTFTPTGDGGWAVEGLVDRPDAG